MTAQLINRRQVKLETRRLLKEATVSPVGMVTLLLALQLVLNLAGSFSDLLDNVVLNTFLYILTMLMGLVLSAGFVLYCMAIRRREHADYATLFDGFSMVGKVIALYFLQSFYVFLWSLLFVVPGIIATYRYRFAIYNLLENPELNIFQALELSKRQTLGYKSQCFLLDLSYLPWLILAALPTYLVNLSYTMTGFYADPAPFFTMLSQIPSPVAVAVCGLWNLIFSYFYYASMTCADLEYFDIAKTTSGITPFTNPYQRPDNTAF